MQYAYVFMCIKVNSHRLNSSMIQSNNHFDFVSDAVGELIIFELNTKCVRNMSIICTSSIATAQSVWDRSEFGMHISIYLFVTHLSLPITILSFEMIELNEIQLINRLGFVCMFARVLFFLNSAWSRAKDQTCSIHSHIDS